MRGAVALALPLVVPGLVIAALWALPGDPASLICPPELCPGADLARRWNLDRGPVAFYVDWLAAALRGDLGRSWTLQQGMPVAGALLPSLAYTAGLVLLAFLPAAGAAGLAAAGRGRATERGLEAVGLLPGVVGALLAAAWGELTFGAGAGGLAAGLSRLGLGALVLLLTDRFAAVAVGGVRATIEAETQRRYVRMAVLRGERVLDNVLVNVLPALAAQARGRLLQLLSGAVIVEVVLGIPGLGQWLFEGTLAQDFGVVLAATWGYSLLCSAVLLAHAGVDAAVARAVRRAPAGVPAPAPALEGGRRP